MTRIGARCVGLNDDAGSTASRLGERSRGVVDAGATSCFLILQSLGRSVARHLAIA